MSAERAAKLLERMDDARVCLIGDMCLDLYWRADMRLSELSRETPHHPLPVVEERYSPGGAGNAARNAAALKPGALTVIGLLGNDWRGDLLARALADAGMDTSHILRSSEVITNTYIKPLRAGISDVVYEDPRIDFENRAPISPALEWALIDALEATESAWDVLLVSDQMRFGCVTEAVRERICAMGRAGKAVIVDSRSRIGAYRDVIIKPNEVEAGRAFGDGIMPDEAGMAALAQLAARHTGCPAVLTGGALGCFVAADGAVHRVPAVPVPPPVDIVGAGDTFLAAMGCALAAGSSIAEAAAIANLASSVTIRKLGTTGTATREEILRAAESLENSPVTIPLF